jgi:hypothetical protein
LAGDACVVYFMIRQIRVSARCLFRCDDFLNPAYLPIIQSDLDSVGMKAGSGQDFFDNATGQLAGLLILFQHDEDFDPGSDIAPVPSFH